jgi:hypothetical protein
MAPMTNALAPSRIVNHLDPKFRKPLSILEAQWDKAALSEEEAQRVNEASGLADLIAGFIAKNRSSNQYANEGVKSNYGYPNGYQQKDVHAQANRLRALISGVGFADEKLAEQPLPNGAEGYFAIPRWQTIAPTYREAVEKVFALLAKQRKGKFYNYREGQLGEQYFRQSEKTAAAFQKLGDEQKGYDILVVPAQFGIWHRGRSVRRAREVMNSLEFGLGTFAVGIMLLTHPEREVQWEQLHIDCAGDEYSPDGDGRFVSAPFFYFNGDGLGFGYSWVGAPHDDFGSPSGFVSQ